MILLNCFRVFTVLFFFPLSLFRSKSIQIFTPSSLGIFTSNGKTELFKFLEISVCRVDNLIVPCLTVLARYEAKYSNVPSEAGRMSPSCDISPPQEVHYTREGSLNDPSWQWRLPIHYRTKIEFACQKNVGTRVCTPLLWEKVLAIQCWYPWWALNACEGAISAGTID